MTKWSSKQVLITGGLGFVGSNLAHRLVAEGADVTVYDVCLENHGGTLTNVAGIHDDITVVKADVRDGSELAPHVRESDIVYHCAAQNSRTTAQEEPHTDVDINCKGILNVLQAAERAETPPHVVFVSTLAVIGKPPSLPVTESTPANPVDVYGANKRAAEQYCRIYDLTTDVSTSVCRPANVYGPRAPVDVSYGIQTTFIATALRDESITVFEPGDIQRDLIHVDDLVSALQRIGGENRAAGELYVLGRGEATTLKQLADEIVDLAGTGSVELVPWPDDWDSIKRGDVYTDPTKIRDEFGWEPAIDLESGLEATIQFYRDHREEYM